METRYTAWEKVKDLSKAAWNIGKYPLLVTLAGATLYSTTDAGEPKTEQGRATKLVFKYGHEIKALKKDKNDLSKQILGLEEKLKTASKGTAEYKELAGQLKMAESTIQKIAKAIYGKDALTEELYKDLKDGKIDILEGAEQHKQEIKSLQEKLADYEEKAKTEKVGVKATEAKTDYIDDIEAEYEPILEARVTKRNLDGTVSEMDIITETSCYTIKDRDYDGDGRLDFDVTIKDHDYINHHTDKEKGLNVKIRQIPGALKDAKLDYKGKKSVILEKDGRQLTVNRYIVLEGNNKAVEICAREGAVIDSGEPVIYTDISENQKTDRETRRREKQQKEEEKMQRAQAEFLKNAIKERVELATGTRDDLREAVKYGNELKVITLDSEEIAALKTLGVDIEKTFNDLDFATGVYDLKPVSERLAGASVELGKLLNKYAALEETSEALSSEVKTLRTPMLESEVETLIPGAYIENPAPKKQNPVAAGLKEETLEVQNPAPKVQNPAQEAQETWHWYNPFSWF